LVSSRKTGEFFYSAVHIDKPLATLATAGRKWLELTRGSIYDPSILWDVANGHRTEGKDTVGGVVHRADRHGLKVRILRAALCNLQIREARVRAAAHDQFPHGRDRVSAKGALPKKRR